jgi:hypothetical protein
VDERLPGDYEVLNADAKHPHSVNELWWNSVAYVAFAAGMIALAGNVRGLFHCFALCTAIFVAATHFATARGMGALLGVSLVSHDGFLFRAEAGVYHSRKPL